MSLAPKGLNVRPITGIPAVQPGDDVAELVLSALLASGETLQQGDVLVVAQKVVSKAEGAIVDLNTITPDDAALKMAETVQKDPRIVHVILGESVRVIRSVPGVLITETHHGFVCANAGVDTSNSLGNGMAILLPRDPDRSARDLQKHIAKKTGVSPSVIISDTFNRPWREGSTNVAIGTSGFVPLDDARGETDDSGEVLRATLVSVADEVASAAQLVMGETGGVPAAIVRGLKLSASNEGSKSLLRDPERDLFR